MRILISHYEKSWVMSLTGVKIINGVCVENGLIFLPIGRNQQGGCEHDRKSQFPHRTRCALINFHRREDACSMCKLTAESMKQRKPEREELTERRVRLTERVRMCEISSWIKVGPHGINFPHNKTNKQKQTKIKQNYRNSKHTQKTKQRKQN